MGVREPAKGIKLLVESNTMNENTIEQLYNTFSQAVESMTEMVGKEKLEKAQTFLKKLKNIENQSTTQDKEDIKELDTLLENI